MKCQGGKESKPFLKFLFHTGHWKLWFSCVLWWDLMTVVEVSVLILSKTVLPSWIRLQTSWSVLLDPCCLWRCRMNVVLQGGVWSCRHIRLFGVCFVHFALSSTESRNTVLFIIIPIITHCPLEHRGML